MSNPNGRKGNIERRREMDRLWMAAKRARQPGYKPKDLIGDWRDNVVTTESGCMVWTRSIRRDGYGQWAHDGAHRKVYELEVGPIPNGLFVLHRCDNPPCVNPAHLWLGTNSDNLKDCVAKGRHPQAQKTHCKNGHQHTPENTRTYRGHRWCRTCDREWHRAKAAS